MSLQHGSGVTGDAQLAEVGARLKAAGDGGLRRQMLRDIRGITRPAIEAMKRSAEETLPHTGGLNQRVANSRFSSRTSLSSRGASVRIVVKGYDYRIDTLGVVRHPVYGDRAVWRTTQVAPGWASRPIDQMKPTIQAAIGHAVDQIARQITR